MSAKKKIFFTYLLNLAEYVTGFLSLFIITPKITGALSEEVYGTYMAVLAFLVFLNYSDFGFLKAADKFGCDEFIRGNRKKEIEVISSACFVQVISLTLFSFIFLALALNPQFVFSGLTPETAKISRLLFLITSLFLFVTLPRQIIYMVARYRIEMYRVSPWLIVANLVNIALVYVIFRSADSLNIVYYYLAANLVSAVAVISVVIHLFRRWDYSFALFVENLRFNRETLKTLWPFASASLLSMVMYVLYFELDNVFVAKFISVRELAFYAVAGALMNFFRRLSSTVIGPYIPKYNEYYVRQDDKGMRRFYLSNVSVVAPVMFIPVAICIVLMPVFIVAWVGEKFLPSVAAAQMLLGIWLFSPMIDIPALVVTAKVRVNIIYSSAILSPAVFWSIVLIFSGRYGIYSVAFAKLFSSIVSACYLVFASHREMRLRFREYGKKILVPMSVSLATAIGLSLPFASLPVTKGNSGLLLVLAIGGGLGVLSMGVYALLSREFRAAIGEDYFTLPKWRAILSSASGKLSE